jgi:hypothetical protein
MRGLRKLGLPYLPTGAVAEALGSLTALELLELSMEELSIGEERHGEHVWEQYITGQPCVLPSLERVMFGDEEPTQTDQLLRFLASTHMPNLKEVNHASSIKPSSSTPCNLEILSFGRMSPADSGAVQAVIDGHVKVFGAKAAASVQLLKECAAEYLKRDLVCCSSPTPPSVFC